MSNFYVFVYTFFRLSDSVVYSLSQIAIDSVLSDTGFFLPVWCDSKEQTHTIYGLRTHRANSTTNSYQEYEQHVLRVLNKQIYFLYLLK